MTNEQLADFIKAGGNDELTPILWERVRKLLYMIADKYYDVNSERCAMCGVTAWDLKQTAYSAYLGAVKAYDGKRGYKFTAYLKFQFKAAIRHLFGKDLLNSANSLNNTVGTDEERDTEWISFIEDKTGLDEFERICEASTAAIVRGAVERLPGNLKIVIYCRYYEELTVKKTALRLSISENEALSRERKAISALRKDKDIRMLAAEYMRLGMF